ncbi:hypothetical protein BaRGS_00010632 [Batillaria attramentaria]|uniref:Uncharacterized protein n=1 Tax=Batillaria attramentaria TaxID=370345 RepID=A0ABD0LEM6_9CAEN
MNVVCIEKNPEVHLPGSGTLWLVSVGHKICVEKVPARRLHPHLLGLDTEIVYKLRLTRRTRSIQPKTHTTSCQNCNGNAPKFCRTLVLKPTEIYTNTLFACSVAVNITTTRLIVYFIAVLTHPSALLLSDTDTVCQLQTSMQLREFE